jgi:hypothetical protein
MIKKLFQAIANSIVRSLQQSVNDEDGEFFFAYLSMGMNLDSFAIDYFDIYLD